MKNFPRLFSIISGVGLIVFILVFSQCKHKPDPQPEPSDPTNTQDSCLVSPEITIDTVAHAACGNSEGYIVVSGSSGTGGNYTFSKNGTDFQSSDTFANLKFGTYTITVMDSAGCTSESAPVTINNISGITFTVSTTPTACASSAGTISVSGLSGGVPPFTFSIDGSTYQVDSLFTGIGVGNYTVYVKDSTACIAVKTASIADAGNVAFTTDTTSPDCGLSNGSVQVHITDGDAPFQFSPDNGLTFQTDSLFSNLAPGSYDVLVKDSNGCESVVTVVLTEKASNLSFSSNTTSSSCTGADGSISVTGSGGAGGYSYNISNGVYSGSNTFSSLAPGTYTVGIKDANGCEYSDLVTVGSSSVSYSSTVAPIISSTCSSVSCHGTPTGTKPDLSSWSAASSVAANIKAELQAGTMPKTGSISANDKALIICWIDQGAPNN